jgi:hypothetical protein
MTQTLTRPVATESRQKTPPYRIIYNWDGAPHHYSEYPQTTEQFLEKTYAPLTDTQVDALFWSMGTHEATWLSENIPVAGDTVGRVYDGVMSMRDTENLRAMFERGEDPYDAMVARGRELDIDVWPSIRMNDQHFWDIDSLDAMQKSNSQGMTDMRKQHPEWCLGDDAPNWCTSSWNMAILEVREHKLDLIEQACRLADWDGVELDWQRHAFHLPGKHEYRLRYALTDLQRAIRQMTDRIAEERGRPFPVAVRVAATMEACRRVGYDVETWAKEGLCDVIIGGGNSGTDPCFETENFLELAQDTNIRVYPGYDFDSRQMAKRLLPHSEWRDRWYAAMSQGHFDRGADGIYIFNWHAGETTRRKSLTTIGSPETLKRQDKAYTAIQRSIANNPLREDSERDDRLYGEVPVTLYRTLTGDGPTFHVPVSDEVDADRASVQLLIEFEHFSPTADEVQVSLDGVTLGLAAVRNVTAEDPTNPGDVDENSWLVWDMEPRQAAKGPHEIKVVLIHRDPRIRTPIVVNNVEFWVTYG